ncbi:hypothetical protein FB451DRAFT_1559441 [Mycena latifolia]|nr:hypothetical protein FB451DRAFT_1559441 [Mycena latifolia]
MYYVWPFTLQSAQSSIPWPTVDRSGSQNMQNIICSPPQANLSQSRRPTSFAVKLDASALCTPPATELPPLPDLHAVPGCCMIIQQSKKHACGPPLRAPVFSRRPRLPASQTSNQIAGATPTISVYDLHPFDLSGYANYTGAPWLTVSSTSTCMFLRCVFLFKQQITTICLGGGSLEREEDYGAASLVTKTKAVCQSMLDLAATLSSLASDNYLNPVHYKLGPSQDFEDWMGGQAQLISQSTILENSTFGVQVEHERRATLDIGVANPAVELTNMIRNRAMVLHFPPFASSKLDRIIRFLQTRAVPIRGR